MEYYCEIALLLENNEHACGTHLREGLPKRVATGAIDALLDARYLAWNRIVQTSMLPGPTFKNAYRACRHSSFYTLTDARYLAANKSVYQLLCQYKQLQALSNIAASTVLVTSRYRCCQQVRYEWSFEEWQCAVVVLSETTLSGYFHDYHVL